MNIDLLIIMVIFVLALGIIVLSQRKDEWDLTESSEPKPKIGELRRKMREAKLRATPRDSRPTGSNNIFIGYKSGCANPVIGRNILRDTSQHSMSKDWREGKNENDGDL